MVNTISSIGRWIKIEHVYHFGQGYPGITSLVQKHHVPCGSCYKLHIYKHILKTHGDQIIR